MPDHPLFGSGPVACFERGDVRAHWWPTMDRNAGDLCLCGKRRIVSFTEDGGMVTAVVSDQQPRVRRGRERDDGV